MSPLNENKPLDFLENQTICKVKFALPGGFSEPGAVRYRHSFLSKLIQSEDSLKLCYVEIKNLLLSFLGVKARISFGGEAFKKARMHVARLNVKGKSLTVELALAPENYNQNKYRFADNSAKCPHLPMLLRVRSPRSLRYCLELIGEQMRVLGCERDALFAPVEYQIPYESTDALIARGLIKVIAAEKGLYRSESREAGVMDEGAPPPSMHESEEDAIDAFLADDSDGISCQAPSSDASNGTDAISPSHFVHVCIEERDCAEIDEEQADAEEPIDVLPHEIYVSARTDADSTLEVAVSPSLSLPIQVLGVDAEQGAENGEVAESAAYGESTDITDEDLISVNACEATEAAQTVLSTQNPAQAQDKPADNTHLLRDLFICRQSEQIPSDDTTPDLLVFPANESDEAITVEIDLDDSELSLARSQEGDVQILFDGTASATAGSEMLYYPPYGAATYGVYTPPLAPTYGAYAPASAPYGVYTPPASSYGEPYPPKNEPTPPAYRPVQSVPEREDERDSISGMPPKQTYREPPRQMPAPPPPEISDDPLSSALAAALYSSDVAGEAALAQAQRCGFDEIFHESWLENE